jgi:hypothetical protein
MHLLGHQSAGLPITDQHGRNIISGQGSAFSEKAFDRYIDVIQPDIVFCLTDING